MSILLMYHTVDGHTRTIAQHLQQHLQQHNKNCTVKLLTDVGINDMQNSDVLVLGSSVRYGKHHRIVQEFIQRHSDLLQIKPSVFFSVNVVARKAGKDTAQGNPYVRRFLQKIAWQPQHVAVIAGKIDYPAYNWLDKQIIRLIMKITGGPTDTSKCFEFTNWQAVDALADKIAELAS